MSRTRRALVALLLAGGLTAGPLPAHANDSGDYELAQVRRATARYHDPALAVADGYLATEHCVDDPQLGGMGLHFVNESLVFDPAVDPTRPEILVYEALPGGKLRLVAVEWFSVDPDQDVATDEGRPTLFGVTFDGPMQGHEPGMPVHFDLHAWVWKYNPNGMFSAWNPLVHCS